MEGPQDKRPIKTIKHLTFSIRNVHGARKQEELRKLQLFVQAELAAKKIRDDADIAAHKPYVRPEPVRIPVYKEEIEKRPGVEVPEDQIFKVVEFNGSFARLKCMRNPVATPSPPQTPPPQSPPPIPMPEEGDQQCESSQVGTSRQLRTKIEPPNMFFSHMKPPKRVLLQMTAPRMVLLQVRTPKVEAPKGVPLLVVPLLVIPPKIVRRHADAPKGDPSQQAVPSQQKGINILRPQKVPLQINTPNKVLFQVKPPKIVPPQGLPRPQRDIPQPAVDGDKPPIQKVVMVRLLDNDSGLPSSSTVMNQHDYARPSTSRGTMAKEELEDIHANFQYEGRNWRNQATYKVTDVRKRKRLEMEKLAAVEALLPQYRIVPNLNLRPVITRRAKETVVTEAVSSSSDGRLTNIQTRSRIQVVNSGTRGTRDNDPVSSSSEYAECSRMNANHARAKRVLKYVPRVEDSDTDESD